MKTAEGIGAWHNQYNNRSLTECVERAKRAQLDFVIVKYGYPVYERAYAEAGIPWATERFVYANQPEYDGDMLADAVDAGACFAVINAEEGGGWGPDEKGRGAMARLIDTFRIRHYPVPLYACLDTRGDRLNHPYQQEALKRCNGIMPMIYPGAFYPHQPVAYVGQAFRDSLNGKGFRGKPVYPVLQSYSWECPQGYAAATRRMGPEGIARQWAQVIGYGLTGAQFYTIHHATDEEWDAVCILKPEPKPDPLTAKEKCELAIFRGSKPLIHLATDGEWAKLHAKLHEMKVEPA